MAAVCALSKRLFRQNGQLRSVTKPRVACQNQMVAALFR